MVKMLRQEKKYLLTYYDYILNNHYIEGILTKDEYCNEFGYNVRTLYFDTFDNEDYYDNLEDLSFRRKIRLRIYNTSDNHAYLEMKTNQNDYQLKQSLKISKEDANELIKCNYKVLLKYDDDFAKECFVIMSEKKYIPKTIIEYKRKAFYANGNNIRVNFDFDIMSNESNFNLFDNKLPLYPVFPSDMVIFEVKHNGFIFSYIKEALNNFDKSELYISKYNLARSMSMFYLVS